MFTMRLSNSPYIIWHWAQASGPRPRPTEPHVYARTAPVSVPNSDPAPRTPIPSIFSLQSYLWFQISNSIYQILYIIFKFDVSINSEWNQSRKINGNGNANTYSIINTSSGDLHERCKRRCGCECKCKCEWDVNVNTVNCVFIWVWSSVWVWEYW